MSRRPIAATVALFAFALPAAAHQPVMDMAPRWKDGWGFQLRYEQYGSDRLQSGASKIDNPFGLDKSVHTAWLEGIYTFRREFRLSVKIPYVDQERTVIENTVIERGSFVKIRGRGLGDVIVGMPLKRYTNDPAATSNIALTPQVRLPSGSTSDTWPVGDGSTDWGLSLSASWERYHLYQFYDLFYWKNDDGKRGIDQGDELGFDANIGWHPVHDNLTDSGWFLMLDVSARWEQRGLDVAGTTGGKRLSAGPVVVWYRGGVMARAEFRYPLYEDLKGVQVSRGPEFNTGIGFVF